MGDLEGAHASGTVSRGVVGKLGAGYDQVPSGQAVAD